MTQRSIQGSLIRGGTSKGLFLHQRDIPADPATRDVMLLRLMGSPDPRQIDGVGGGHPLTSKVAIIGPSSRDDADVDYLFLQVAVDKAEVSSSQNCGNLLAGVGPFAIEHGYVRAQSGTTAVRIHLVNSASVATALVHTPDAQVCYQGQTRIDGVPGSAAAVLLEFADIAGSSCGALWPTGLVREELLGVQVSCIDNGMPVVLMAAADLGVSGYETPAELEGNVVLTQHIEQLRLAAGQRMGLGDVQCQTVPKMVLVAPALHGGLIHSRSFIPHRVHEAIGVLGAVSVATACITPGSVAALLLQQAPVAGTELRVEHPTGNFGIQIDFSSTTGLPELQRVALVRTARKLMDGQFYY